MHTNFETASVTERALNILLVEDSPDDVELVVMALRAGGFAFQHLRVDTAATMAHALDTQAWDLVISDWSMPTFSALAAHHLLRERGLDLPFIIVSGTVSEETAVEALRAGAHDFMSKDRLTRLVPAVHRELEEAATRAERKRLQDQLLLADRMSTIGVLTAGVAHEINNPLACVMGTLELALRELNRSSLPASPSTRLPTLLQDAADAAEQIRRIVLDMRVFSRGQSDERELIDLHSALDFAVRMSAHQVNRTGRLHKAYGSVPPVMANQSRLGQVFLNLIINATQALDPTTLRRNEIHVETRTDPQGRAVVVVRDNGCGIPAQVMRQIFSPFLTTKPVGVGTGLGLSICQRIVTELDGAISVDSHEGEGTSFTIVLPGARPSGFH